ncbi:hypothetical protein [Actinomadura alba]|uniref:hypothetical protein n=1 Tax=Actinomadura alba TaxID=406431 RepID=UPI001FE60738|nr:hypothetical protein [Actinomadura alba]
MHEFHGHMLGIGGRAAISEGEQPTTSMEADRHGMTGGGDLTGGIGQPSPRRLSLFEKPSHLTGRRRHYRSLP